MACETDEKLKAQIELKINGKKIELNNFAQNFISRTVIGMVKSLQGVDEVETISLTISDCQSAIENLKS